MRVLPAATQSCRASGTAGAPRIFQAPDPFAAAFFEASGNPDNFRHHVQHMPGAGVVMPMHENIVVAGKTPMRSLYIVKKCFWGTS